MIKRTRFLVELPLEGQDGFFLLAKCDSIESASEVVRIMLKVWDESDRVMRVRTETYEVEDLPY